MYFTWRTSTQGVALCHHLFVRWAQIDFGVLWIWDWLGLWIVFIVYNVCFCAYSINLLKYFTYGDMFKCICTIFAFYRVEGSNLRLTGVSDWHLFSETYPLLLFTVWLSSQAIAMWFGTFDIILLKPIILLLRLEFGTRTQDWAIACKGSLISLHCREYYLKVILLSFPKLSSLVFEMYLLLVSCIL